MAIRCAETCLDGECTCRPSSHDDEMARVDAMSRGRRADAIRAETNAAMDGRDFPLRDRLDELAVQATELARLS
ncbi:hypothetical protein D9623_33705 (plasmid) [Azospirillum brasilense]|nr:hypothetical protein D9623_26725 [Azospirillum brasilense]QEM01373.1 hypothetical protein D9623_33705 [Azospirillum brasilense]TVZ67418.1 hypothetical protein OH82_00558 [Azospirillum brasilense]TWB84863.1 hypothetical protein FBZ81_103129 [Azospirillum brasilense]